MTNIQKNIVSNQNKDTSTTKEHEDASKTQSHSSKNDQNSEQRMHEAYAQMGGIGGEARKEQLAREGFSENETLRDSENAENTDNLRTNKINENEDNTKEKDHNSDNE